MFTKMMTLTTHTETKFWLRFALKTVFYLVVLFALLYIYHYSQVSGSGFIYNEF